MTFIEFMYFVMIVEVAIILFVAGVATIGFAIGWIDNKLHPRYPSCDIDPLVHPAFVFDKDGNGWIGNVKVRL